MGFRYGLANGGFRNCKPDPSGCYHCCASKLIFPSGFADEVREASLRESRSEGQLSRLTPDISSSGFGNLGTSV